MTTEKKQPYTYTVPTLADRGKMIDYIRMECKAKRQLTDIHLYKSFGTQSAIERLTERGYMKKAPEHGTDIYEFTDYELNAEDIAADVWKRSGRKQLRIVHNKAKKTIAVDATQLKIETEVPILMKITKQQVQSALDLVAKYQIQDAAGYIADHLNNAL